MVITGSRCTCWLAAVVAVAIFAQSLPGTRASAAQFDDLSGIMTFSGVDGGQQRRALQFFEVESVNGPISQNCSHTPWRVRHSFKILCITLIALSDVPPMTRVLCCWSHLRTSGRCSHRADG